MNSTFKNAKILIVDDNVSNIELLEGILEETGYTNIQSTKDPRQVVELYKTFNPDLILLDLMMPYLSGYDIMELLRLIVPAQTYLPILVLTSDITFETKKRALSSGAKDFLSKPFDLNEVCIRIKNLLETRYLHQLLEEQNQTLAQKVEERTADLEKAYEKIMDINEELKILDLAKLDFIRLISHELRTPLNGIKGFTGILKKRIESPQLLEYIDYLEASILRLEKFSYQALLITELRTHIYKITPEEVPILELLENAKKQLPKKLKSKKIDIQLQIENSTNTIYGDFKLVQICFECLLDNSVKYSPEDEIVVVNVFGRDHQTICEFNDNGLGFSLLALNNLFNLFGVGDKHFDQNTGLNLALIKLIMDAHNAEINVSNNQPKGATVQLIFNNR
ncbi:MAG: response regulator [Paludibacter sp.]